MRKPIMWVLLLLVPLLAIQARAHPGRTDGNGGHTNRSTGDYHYHHGYPPHDHYDMDGDGAADCPYDFKDKTGHTSGSSVYSSDSYYYTTNAPETVSPALTASTTKTGKTDAPTAEVVETIPLWAYLLFVGQLLVSVLIFVFFRKKIDRMTYEYRNDLEVMKNAYKYKLKRREASDADLKAVQARISAKEAELAELDKQKQDTLEALRSVLNKIESKETELSGLSNKIQNTQREIDRLIRTRSTVNNAPPNITFSENGMPVYWKPSKEKPYGDFTVYISRRSSVYHINPLCASYNATPAHIFSVIKTAHPCKKCALGAFDFDDVPEWYK